MSLRKNLNKSSAWQLYSTKTNNDEHSPIFFGRDGHYFRTSWDRFRFDLPEFPFEEVSLTDDEKIALFESADKDTSPSIEINSRHGRSTQAYNQFYIHSDGSVLASGENRLGSLGIGYKDEDKSNARRINPVKGIPKNLAVKKIVADLHGTIVIMQDGQCYACGDIFYRPESRYQTTFHELNIDSNDLNIVDAHLLLNNTLLLTQNGSVYSVWNGLINRLSLPEHIIEFCGNYFVLFLKTKSNAIYVHTPYTKKPACITRHLDKALEKAKQNRINSNIENPPTLNDLPNDMLKVISEPLSYHSLRALRMTSRFFNQHQALAAIQKNKTAWQVYIDNHDIYFSHLGKTHKLDQSADGFTLYPSRKLDEKKWAALEKTNDTLSPNLFELGPFYHNQPSGNRFFLSRNGEVLAQGSNNDGSLGIDKKTEPSISPVIDEFNQTHTVVGLPQPAEIYKIVGNEKRTFFIMQNGRCYACGDNSERYLGILRRHPYHDKRLRPTRLETEIKIKDIILLDKHALILDINGHLYRTGRENFVLTPIKTDDSIIEWYTTHHWTAIIKTVSNKTYVYSTMKDRLINIDKLLDMAINNPEKLGSNKSRLNQ